jgi:hypothetical protein
MANGAATLTGKNNGGLFRRGDLPILFLLLVQLATAAYFFGKLEQRVNTLESQQMQMEYRLNARP